MWLTGWIARLVRMLMMFIMNMGVVMNHRRMDMPVLVVLGEMEPDTDRHQQTGRYELPGHRLRQQDHGRDRPQKWRGGKIGAGARCSEVA